MLVKSVQPWRKIPDGVLALLDQGLISITSILTSIAIGRQSKAELGLFGLSMSIVILISCMQDSLFGFPFTVLSKRQSQPRTFLGSSLVGVMVLALVASLVLGATATLASGILPLGLSPLMLIVCLTLPFHLTRLFLRRVLFASLQFGTALAFDLLASLIHIGILGMMWQRQSLTSPVGHVAFGASAVMFLILWLVMERGSFQLSIREVAPQLRKNWAFGKSVLASQLLWIMHVNAVTWTLYWLHGNIAAGEFTACLTTILFANPFVLGILNVLSPRASRSFESGGLKELRSVIGINFGILMGGMTCLWIGLLFWGGPLIQLLFGDSFQGDQSVIMLLGIGMLAETACKAPEHGLLAVERPQQVTFVNWIRLVLAVTVAVTAIPRFGLWGAAAALAVSDVVAAILLTTIFVRDTSPNRQHLYQKIIGH